MRRARPFAGWLLLSLLLGASASAGDGFVIRNAELTPVGSDYVLNADIRYDFSTAAIEALENSVPLTLVLRLQIQRMRPHWWHETLVDQRHHVQIRYQPLGRLYQLRLDERGFSQSYTSLNYLLEAMGTIRRLPVIATELIRTGERYAASLSVRLDIETLPLPLRPTAYLSPSWYLSSPVYRWSFARSD